MVHVVFLSTFWHVFWPALVTWFIIIPLVMLWVFALADLTAAARILVTAVTQYASD